MAINCTYCGREVPPGSSVCPACGQTVAAAPAPAPAFTPVNPGGPATPGYGQESTPYVSAPYTNAPPPASSGGGALKIILIVVAVFVFLGLLVVGGIGYVGWRASRAIHAISEDGKTGSFSMNTPGGTITAGGKASVTESDLGIAIYPGATRGEGSMNIKTPTGTLVTATYVTSDSPSRVVEFYKGKLGESASTIDTGNATMISSGGDDNNKVMVTVTSGDGKTKVTIMHSTKKP